MRLSVPTLVAAAMFLTCTLSAALAQEGGDICAVAPPKEAESCALSRADQAAIRDVMESYRTDWLALDADGVIGLFTEDAVLVPNGRLDPVLGRPAARQNWFPNGQKWLPLTSFSLSIDDLGGCGNFAYVRGISNVGWEQDGKPMHAIGAYITLLRKTSDGWRITLQMWDSAK